MRSPQLARYSRDQLRRRMGQHGAALARGRGGGREVFRAPPSLGQQLEAPAPASRTQSRVREHGGRRTTPYSPRTPIPLTRRLRRTVAVWPEEPGLTPAPALLRRRHLLLHGPRAASPDAASPGAATRGVACAAPPGPGPAPSLCAAPPAPRRLRRARAASRRAAARGAASPGSASHRTASSVSPPRAAL